MSKDKFQLTKIKIISGDYIKPKKTNKFIDDKEYSKIDKACELHAFLSEDGNGYVEEDALYKFLHSSKSDAKYIAELYVSDDGRKNIGGSNVIKSSEIVGILDKRVHELIESQKAAISKYSRDSLINIGDCPKAEAIRRQRDEFVSKTEKTLKSKRGIKNDEITGQELKKNSAFHHEDKKSIFTDPEARINPQRGKNVNLETHQEIHRRGISTKEELEKQAEDIKKVILNDDKNNKT